MLPFRKISACLGVFVFFNVSSPGDVAPTSDLWWSTRGRSAPLSAQEEASPALATLARRYNPAMALPATGIWPVEVRYAWRDGADLVGKVMGEDGKPVREFIAVRNAELETRPWADLPKHDPSGRPIRYGIDAPGDDIEENGLTRWRKRWNALVGREPQAHDEAAQPALNRQVFPPTQYAHVFWFNKDEGLLGIQYWFFYPFNEWVNRHEGDWEHVNVILKGPSTLDPARVDEFEPVGYQFAFHSWRYDTENVVRVGGSDPREDHVVVFVGGRGRLLWWGGTLSGASYPLPALYPGAGSGPIKPTEDTRDPERFLAAGQFKVVLLPEPERLDAKASPELSWLRLPFYAGQDRVHTNPPLVDWLGHGGSVIQPAQRKTWNAQRGKRHWDQATAMLARALTLPADWPLLRAPWLSQNRAVAAERGRAAPATDAVSPD